MISACDHVGNHQHSLYQRGLRRAACQYLESSFQANGNFHRRLLSTFETKMLNVFTVILLQCDQNNVSSSICMGNITRA